MSFTPPPEEREPVNKGKARAASPDATERTPLLASSSYSAPTDPESSSHARRRLITRLTCVFLTTLVICIIVLILIAAIAWSYAARVSKMTPSDILQTALVVRGPDRVDVLNITQDGGIWLNVQGRVGLDAGAVLGVNENDEDGIWRDVWKGMGRWGVRRMDKLSVNLSTIQITPYGIEDGRRPVLARIHTPRMELPLTSNPPPDLSWLTPMTLPLHIMATHNTSDLIQFTRDTWRDGLLAVRAELDKVDVVGGGLDDGGWRRRFNVERPDVVASIRVKIPTFPGLPAPGRNAPLPAVRDLVTLQSLNIITKDDQLSLDAQATILDPAPPTFNFTSPRMPFVVSILDDGSSLVPLPVASVYTHPFSLTHPNITLLISGSVLPLSRASAPLLSTFLTRYLSGKDNPVIITTPIFPEVTAEAAFPGPSPRPHLLRNVTIHDMRIKPKGSVFVASGTVYARVVLPRGMDVDLDANRVLPDVLVFDGEVPDDEVGIPDKPDGDVPQPPLPDPLPERAFAHIRPDDWVASKSVKDREWEEDDVGAVYTVLADIVEVPLEVLPGREGDFSSFVRKVIFGSSGAVAGIQGTAAVAVVVHGLPIDDGENGGEMELTGLPFKGSVRVGKKGVFTAATGMRMPHWTEKLSPSNWPWPKTD